MEKPDAEDLAKVHCDSPRVIERISDVKPADVAWLWPGRIPIRKSKTATGTLEAGPVSAGRSEQVSKRDETRGI